jgi:hypothetical protein
MRDLELKVINDGSLSAGLMGYVADAPLLCPDPVHKLMTMIQIGEVLAIIRIQAARGRALPAGTEVHQGERQIEKAKINFGPFKIEYADYARILILEISLVIITVNRKLGHPV